MEFMDEWLLHAKYFCVQLYASKYINRFCLYIKHVLFDIFAQTGNFDSTFLTICHFVCNFVHNFLFIIYVWNM